MSSECQSARSGSLPHPGGWAKGPAAAGPTDDASLLLYDGQCPACTCYCRLVEMNAKTGRLRLVDARDTAAAQLIDALGLDPDQGMALIIGGEAHVGAAALHALACMEAPSSPFNRLNRQLFRSRFRARLAYPLLRLGRNILLRLGGRSKIDVTARSSHAPNRARLQGAAAADPRLHRS